ncbi:hypothetical protein FW774_09925 [Pedobacter sp. BS3]|uniref:hypothetical protein n=1 Tax=Pedobacter sp. BS3 TaxID=2567937 RepID=UPI0011EBD9DD|nr:hypothetical protein [Pedobacter sp. BS3]TZF83777.1 hypothetical protein FW774_09925 [Pedobacter sp. BS3]
MKSKQTHLVYNLNFISNGKRTVDGQTCDLIDKNASPNYSGICMLLNAIHTNLEALLTVRMQLQGIPGENFNTAGITLKLLGDNCHIYDNDNMIDNVSRADLRQIITEYNNFLLQPSDWDILSSKAKQYHLKFEVLRYADGTNWPKIFCNNDFTGSTINRSLADFIDGMGPKSIDSVIYDITSENPFNRSISEYQVWGGYEEVVEIFSSPARAVFNDGMEVPLQDFLDILQEWKDFLNSLPYKHTHTLSNM